MQLDESARYKLAITKLPNIGDVVARKLIAYCGGVEAVFRESKSMLEKVPGVGKVRAALQKADEALALADREMEFISRFNINAAWYLEGDYPSRLKHCDDSPLVLYTKGEMDLNTRRLVSIVGTRKATPYGKKVTEQLVAALAEKNIPVVSGLAYGIDIAAHRAALKNDVATMGVLAHGLDRIYPHHHRAAAEKMIKNGGLVTEFMSQTNPDRENFPKRNRIIAGLADATIVIESRTKGGSLITAEIANSYNRDVFAVPGRVSDESSSGCHYLIRTNRAHLLSKPDDLFYLMGWLEDEKPKATWTVQPELFKNLSPEEAKLVKVLKEKGQTSIDSLGLEASLSTSVVATSLLNLEFAGIVRSLPGKVYELN